MPVKITTRPTPRFDYQRFPTPEAAGRHIAGKILDISRTGRGTVLTPGCTTPLPMYQALTNGFISNEDTMRLSRQLRGLEGDFKLGMIDAIEWPLEHPLSFRFYLITHFLRFFGLGRRPYATASLEENNEAIVNVYKDFPNVYVPHLPFRATPEQVVFQVEQFSDWLKPRLPIDLVVLGLGTDHICFLKPGTTYDPSGPLASRVELWDIIKKQKWIDESDMRCACIKDCADVICQVNDHLAPDFAITITLKLLMESAKEIWILVTGEHKAGTVKRLLFGNPDTNEYAVDYFDAIRDRVKVILDDGAGISTFV